MVTRYDLDMIWQQLPTRSRRVRRRRAESIEARKQNPGRFKAGLAGGMILREL